MRLFMTNRTAVGIAVAALIGGIAALGWTYSIWSSIGSASPTATAEGPTITSEFELADQTGRTVRDEDLGGKWQLVFFGFTSCPDICPTALSNVTATLEELGPAAEKLQPLLITVDPERDTPAVLKEYLDAFDPRIMGLTGPAEQVSAALRSFRVYASKRELEGGDYTMDHSAFIYLMDPEGAYAAHFSAQTPINELTEKIRAAVDAEA
jgi:protein SCO1/2